MKKYVLLLLMSILSLTLSAAKKDNPNAVSMVLYEQDWLDNEATLALRNNTKEDIHNVQYVIKYLDMEENQLDYEEYASVVEIAPGLTRKVNIPAYEHGRFYSYYNSEEYPGDAHPFKVEFELVSYNNASDNSDKMELVSPSFGVFFILIPFLLGAVICLFVLVGVLAKRYHRSVAIWLLLSFIATPLLMVIILLCLGEAEKKQSY